jgi:hypothetical protein
MHHSGLERSRVGQRSRACSLPEYGFAHQGRLDEGVDLLQKPVSQAQLTTRVAPAPDRKI